jgi:hypothetical protein
MRWTFKIAFLLALNSANCFPSTDFNRFFEDVENAREIYALYPQVSRNFISLCRDCYRWANLKAKACKSPYDGKSGTVKSDPTYVQTTEKNLSQTPQKKGDIASKLAEKTEFENLSQISSDIKSGEMDTQLDPQTSQNSEKSIWEKIRLEPNLDLIGKIVSELYPPAAGLKPSDITELLSNKKLTREISSNMKSAQALGKNNGVKPNIPTNPEKDTAKTSSLVSLILAWLGIN